MVISLKKLIIYILGIILLLAVIVSLWLILTNKDNKYVMGGYLHTESMIEKEYPQTVFNYDNNPKQEFERFQRPSKQPALKTKYIYSHNEKYDNQSPLNQKIFSSSEDVVQAYFAFLEEASNMTGYCGGCGTIGYSREPYPHTYKLLSDETKQKMSLDEFISSFLGIGHTTLLKLMPAYAPPETPENIKYYMVEIEIITGPKCSEVDDNELQPSYFAYYYGLITTEETHSEGWKIKSVDYVPEDFLCAPYHHWYWESTAVVQIIFGGWYNLVDEIEKVDIEGSYIKIYAKGKQNRYRFDAVRLTNGTDIFLHEYIWENGKWKEVDYIVEKHKYLKFSIWKIQSMKKDAVLKE